MDVLVPAIALVVGAAILLARYFRPPAKNKVDSKACGGCAGCGGDAPKVAGPHQIVQLKRK
ncbi:MAG: hypothetical protein JXX14_18925 [Deltaproteobacteria bacterium]|nr:hypothetical protein [Deltaproteobacteria bacterium]